MAIEVRRVEPPDDEELLEQWIRTDGDDLANAEALLPDDHPWQIIVGMAEFLRAEPLESRLSDAVHQALVLVPGVTRVEREDTEVWLAWGTPNGGDLVRAAAEAIDPLVPAAKNEQRKYQQHDHPGRREAGSPIEKGPLIASLVLAAIGAVLLVSGLAGGDTGTALLGAVAVLFFGGGSLALVLLRR